MLEEAFTAPWRRLLSFTLCVCSVVGPPTIFVAEYIPNLFLAVDASKLILLAIGLNSPIFIGAWLLCLEVVERDEKSENQAEALEHWHLTSAMMAALMTMIPLNVAALLKLLYFHNLLLTNGVWISVGSTAFIWAICWFIGFSRRKERDRKMSGESNAATANVLTEALSEASVPEEPKIDGA